MLARLAAAMARSRHADLSAVQETEAQALVLRIRELADEELVEVARLLVNCPEHETFGDTEFELRDLVLRIGGKAPEEHVPSWGRTLLKRWNADGPAGLADGRRGRPGPVPGPSGGAVHRPPGRPVGLWTGPKVASTSAAGWHCGRPQTGWRWQGVKHPDS